MLAETPPLEIEVVKVRIIGRISSVKRTIWRIPTFPLERVQYMGIRRLLTYMV